MAAWAEFAEKKEALSEPLRMVRAMKPSSASSYSRRSEIRTWVGILVWVWPMASNWYRGRLSTSPPPWGPMMFAHQRYLAKLSVSREAKAKAVFPQQKCSLSSACSLNVKDLAGTVVGEYGRRNKNLGRVSPT